MTPTNFSHLSPADLPAIRLAAECFGLAPWQVAVSFNAWRAGQSIELDLSLQDQINAWCRVTTVQDIVAIDLPQSPDLFVLAEPVKCEDVALGELFSAAGPEYWSTVPQADPAAIGERVFLRTLGPVYQDDIGTTTYRLTLITDPLTAAVYRADSLRSRPGSGLEGVLADVQRQEVA